MNSSNESHASENGVVSGTDPAVVARRRRLTRAFYAGASAGLRTFTVPAAALRAKDNAWAPLFASLARTELIYDKMPDVPSRLSARGLIFRAIAASASAAALATRKEPQWVPLVVAALIAASATAVAGATARVRGAKGGIPDFVLAALEDQLAAMWAERAFAGTQAVRDQEPAIKTLSLL